MDRNIPCSKIKIDRNSRVPYYLQISNQIKEMILQEVILPGKRLPSTRKLAPILGLNRSTIVLAYSELLAEGLVAGRIGQGTIALGSEQRETDDFQMPVSRRWNDYLATFTNYVYDTLILEGNEWRSQEDAISLAGGDASPELYPIRDVQEIVKDLMENRPREVLRTSSCQGIYPLRRAIADEMTREGKSTKPEEVIIVSGSLQGLSLLSRILLDPGDSVVVESPTFLGALQVFRAAQAKIIGVPLDKNGIRLDILENILSRQKPKIIYVLPTYQNPSGIVLSLERRIHLLNLVYRYNVAIIEEDPYGKIFFEKEPPPSLKSMDKSNIVIHLGTCSKTLFPGLRIGWIIASSQVIKRLAKARQFDDMHASTLSQEIITEFYQRNLMDRHLAALRKAYKNKRDIMIGALEKHCSAFMSWNRPEGGFYIWCRLKAGLRSSEILADLPQRKVSILPGGAFFPRIEDGESWLRLNFTYENEDQLQKGIEILGKVLMKEYGEKRARLNERKARYMGQSRPRI